jgi:hypothetical protein
VHCFVIEGVVGAFILHVVCAIETVLVAPFLLIACGTCVPIFHIKPTAVADILLCKVLYNVGKKDMLPLLWRLDTGRDVWNHVTSHEWIGGHWDAPTSAAAATSGMAALAAPSAIAPTTPLLVLMLETLQRGCGVGLCWRLDVLIVAWHGCIDRQEHHLLHHCLMLLPKLLL